MDNFDDEPRDPGTDEGATPPRWLMERTQLRLQRRFEAEGGGPPDEATLKRLIASSRAEEVDLEDLEDAERAQEVAFDAMEANTQEEALALADQAFALDPQNVDALHLQAVLGTKSPKERIAGLTRALEAGAAALGEVFFEENRGTFYGLIQTRPYMRARIALAGALVAGGQLNRAIEHYEALLELNASDNQANRCPLLGLYLRRGDVAAARALSDLFEQDSASMAWGRVLLLWLEGDKGRADVAVFDAAKRNAFVAARLREPAEDLEGQPPQYSPGTASEVPVVLGHLRPAFEGTPGFMSWLLERLAEWDHLRAYNWVERQEKARDETAPDWALGFFELAANASGGLEARPGMPASETDLAWYRLIATDPGIRGGGAPGYGFAACAAVNLLGGDKSTETAEFLVELQVELEREDSALDAFSDAVEGSLGAMEALVVEPALAALEAGHKGPEGFSWLLVQLANAGVRDERILTLLLGALPGYPDPIAAFLADYGDPAALPVLGVTLDEVLVRAREDALRESSSHQELCGAIKSLGGVLTPAQIEASLELSKARLREARSAGPDRPAPSEQAYAATAEPQEPLRAKERPGRNEPCWCGSGTKYKRCHLIEDESGGGS